MCWVRIMEVQALVGVNISISNNIQTINKKLKIAMQKSCIVFYEKCTLLNSWRVI